MAIETTNNLWLVTISWPSRAIMNAMVKNFVELKFVFGNFSMGVCALPTKFLQNIS